MELVAVRLDSAEALIETAGRWKGWPLVSSLPNFKSQLHYY